MLQLQSPANCLSGKEPTGANFENKGHINQGNSISRDSTENSEKNRGDAPNQI